jgi:hypothetical protein
MRDRILKTGRETNGQLFEVEFSVEPGDWTAPDHIHLRQEERFRDPHRRAPAPGRRRRRSLDGA